MKLRYGWLLLAICAVAGCSDDIASSVHDGVTTAIDEVVVRPVLFMECTYLGEDVTDADTGQVTLASGTTIKTDFYLSRPLLSDGEWIGFALYDEITGQQRDLLFGELGITSQWTCAEPVSGEPVAG